MAAPPTNAELVKAFRQLYRSGLRAIQFSKPARYVLRDQLRAAFRGRPTPLTSDANNTTPPPFNALDVRRTVYFFNAAASDRGIEHKVLKNLLVTAYHRRRRAQRMRTPWAQIVKAAKTKEQDEINKTAYDHYDETVAMLNKTMGLCLR